MKKILDGKLYDTQKAKMIGEHCNGYWKSDFRYKNEELYKKENGEFFLYGEGGPLSSYAISYGNDFCYGETIIPFELSDAKKWCEKYLDVDKYIEIFGEPEE